MAKVTLNPLTPEDGEIISHETIEQAIDGGEAYRIIQDGQLVGGVVIKVDGERGDLDLLFVSPKAHSKGIGYAACKASEFPAYFGPFIQDRREPRCYIAPWDGCAYAGPEAADH
jgi:hypothetical protein